MTKDFRDIQDLLTLQRKYLIEGSLSKLIEISDSLKNIVNSKTIDATQKEIKFLAAQSTYNARHLDAAHSGLKRAISRIRDIKMSQGEIKTYTISGKPIIHQNKKNTIRRSS